MAAQEEQQRRRQGSQQRLRRAASFRMWCRSRRCPRCRHLCLARSGLLQQQLLLARLQQQQQQHGSSAGTGHRPAGSNNSSSRKRALTATVLLLLVMLLLLVVMFQLLLRACLIHPQHVPLLVLLSWLLQGTQLHRMQQLGRHQTLLLLVVVVALAAAAKQARQQVLPRSPQLAARAVLLLLLELALTVCTQAMAQVRTAQVLLVVLVRRRMAGMRMETMPRCFVICLRALASSPSSTTPALRAHTTQRPGMQTLLLPSLLSALLRSCGRVGWRVRQQLCMCPRGRGGTVQQGYSRVVVVVVVAGEQLLLRPTRAGLDE